MTILIVLKRRVKTKLSKDDPRKSTTQSVAELREIYRTKVVLELQSKVCMLQDCLESALLRNHRFPVRTVLPFMRITEHHLHWA